MYTLKKSLGQHFLRDENICHKIVDALKLHPFRQLLEVGPGGAALTKYLIQIEDIDFKCVELDEEKVVWLQQNYPALKGKIIHKSILDIDPPFEGKFTVVGNFPYNISSQILFKMLDWKDQLGHMVGMFQKEVAQRVAAPPGSKVYGVVSVLMQAYFKVEYLFEVSETCFNPPPKVKSAVIRMTPLEETFPMASHQKMRTLVKAAFNQRRKTLRNAVKGLFPESELTDPIFNKRAEQLAVADFAALTFKMN
ncbi:16S rRNA (adenine(1518)-N(6)/adenine(1519)-N(6))-dimethyltransferase RsmA [Gynurincola endophyticus]|jgi:16S rRNA (adenine1518-N6/adenine1519-N6)-dimethyltransferase|uniref:16S rRNA (adenine(1518)-N(6)/adenine(1519)-N(6))- dimethyltransferase RsmA n=1 Tax=Gynurincola endophyticus TaxID=2479004 RepID=UPI000F8D6FF8|nr:16S rRNA (adenine(1518)-N(6)/adenine(1519)-N(6))-dimethyltransferase RsmA [Gynurincola endophyticus]